MKTIRPLACAVGSFPVWSLSIMGSLLVSCSATPGGKDGTSQQQQREGWMVLSEDPSLHGWIQRNGRASYRYENGEIVGTTRPHEPNSFLCTKEDFADFELEFDFKVDNQLNSGVQFRSQSLPEYQNGRVHGYQFEIDPSDRAYTAGIYDEARRGTWIANTADNPQARAAFKKGEWNHGRLLSQGDHFQTWINGVPAVDVHDSMTASGFIALQVHSVGDRLDPLEVRWKNVRVRRLPAANAEAPAPAR